jgi:hypothetical protein
MADEITILSVPPDATEHAKRFGAKFDSRTSTWFVVGPVPRELLNYVPRQKNERLQETAPSCPVCGAPTRKLASSKGDLFWGCVTYFKVGCPGMVDYLDYLDDVEPLAKVGKYLPKVVGSLFGPSESSCDIKEHKAHPLKPRWQEIISEAAKIFGDDKQAVRWLYEPKIAFNNKSPVQMCGTEAGCDAVLQLLRDVWK